MPHYINLTSTKLLYLDENVNAYLKEGYKCLGGIQVQNLSKGQFGYLPTIMYYQSMIKE